MYVAAKERRIGQTELDLSKMMSSETSVTRVAAIRGVPIFQLLRDVSRNVQSWEVTIDVNGFTGMTC
jgi:FlaG/FlaF family flagellin (archaellin)